MIETLYARERFSGPVISLLGQQRRPQTVARGVADADAFGRRSQTFAQSRRLRGRNPERPHHLTLIQSQELGRRGRRAEYPAGRGDVPSPVVMTWRHRK